ncbi:MAG: homoserine kinase, partial [Marivirga sp.]|nr:homoserine kinase [Marivirga sp.]
MILKFPVTYSLVSSVTIENELISLYKLPETSRVVFLHQGLNDTYLISSVNEQFILRIYRTGWKSIDDVSAELELLLLLHQGGVPVSYPLH